MNEAPNDYFTEDDNDTSGVMSVSNQSHWKDAMRLLGLRRGMLPTGISRISLESADSTTYLSQSSRSSLIKLFLA